MVAYGPSAKAAEPLLFVRDQYPVARIRRHRALRFFALLFMTSTLALDASTRCGYDMPFYNDTLFCPTKHVSGSPPGNSHRKGRNLMASTLCKLAAGLALLV